MPPARWTRRSWTVASGVCSGLPGHRKSARLSLFSDFACEITLVRETSCVQPDPLAGFSFVRDYCVAGFESFALQRTLHVAGRTRYVLYRG